MSIRSMNGKIILVVIKLNNENSIIYCRDYGKIKLKLKEIMNKKNITRNKLCVLTGVKFDTVQKYYNNNVYRIDVDVLAKFCYALDCEVQDIIEYVSS